MHMTTLPYHFDPVRLDVLKKRSGNKKLFFQALMPVRGPGGFRKLDYEFAKSLDAGTIVKKVADHGFNGFGLVVKDTDGALLSKTKVGWNPTGRDLVQEFQELCQRHGLIYILSVTCFNDAYMGWKSTNGYTTSGTVSVHITGKKGKHAAGDIAVHDEGEMRVDLPEGRTLGSMQEEIPFLSAKFDGVVGQSRGSRGHGYVPRTSFHCPRSEHAGYIVDIVTELARNYAIDGIFADYIRYDGSYTDLCGCERCKTAFHERHPGMKLQGNAWHDFREDNIAAFGKRFNDAIKAVNPEIMTGWFNLTGPKLFTRNRIAQDPAKIAPVMDAAVPMLYPYLTGTSDDGWKWRVLADLAHWYFKRDMRSKLSKGLYGDTPVLAITNSVECNAEEMLISCRDYDYGLGISLFKYFGTTDAQWEACKQYGALLKEQALMDAPPDDEALQRILLDVYKAHPPKNPHLLKWKPA